MTAPILDAQKMKRLALLRLMHGQATELAGQPEPLRAAAVLTLHDVAEHFLILAAEQLAAGPVAKDKDLTQYWPLLRGRRGFRGVELSHQHAIARLISVRNDFKHAGRLPTADEIADARTAVTGLLEENMPKIFGIELAEVDMTYVVQQEDARGRLKAAAAAEAADDRAKAMTELAEAVRDLLQPFDPVTPWSETTYGFGPTVREERGFPIGAETAMTTVASVLQSLGRYGGPSMNHLGGVQRVGRKVDERIKLLSNAVAAMQQGMRILALGIDYPRYDRFRRLTPRMYYAGRKSPEPAPGYAPTREEYEECFQFVVTLSLRIAEVEAASAAPSWQPQGWA